MRKILLGILFIVLIVALFYKSPFSAMYNYNKAKALLDSGRYEESLPYFEKSLFAQPKGILARFYYVTALSKSKPTYSVQKKLYEMANSNILDEASKYAQSQVVSMRYKLLDGIGKNYILNTAMGNDILHWDIRSFPLKVYIDSPGAVPDYYVENINKALKLWSDSTNFVKFTQVNTLGQADIVITFKDIPSDMCTGQICKYTVAYTEPSIDSNKLLKKMTLTFYKTNPHNEKFSQKEIYNTALHEIGHTLGIMGHSETPEDIMYAMKPSDLDAFSLFRSNNQGLTMTDLQTLVLLYRIEPTISNVKNLHSENFYYAPLIMGSDEVRLQKKLGEFKKYIEDYPNAASGYINLASVYVDLGDYASALEHLAKAERVAYSTDERYLIHYNRAIIYFNQQDYTKSLDSANQAKSIKEDLNVDNLIQEIETISK